MNNVYSPINTDFDIFNVCVAYINSKANEHFHYIKTYFKMFIMLIEYESEDVFYHTLLLLSYCQFKETKTFSSSDHFSLITLA